MELKDRLKELIEDRGITLRALGRKIGTSHVSISKWLSGNQLPSDENLEALADFFQTTPAFLRYGQEAASPPPSSALQPADSSVLSIPVLKEAAEASPQAAFVKMLRVDRAWLYAQAIPTMNPEALQIISVTGDGMTPLFRRGDLVIVDTAQTDLAAEGVYAIRYSGSVFLKRVQVLPSGSVALISDNTKYQPVEVSSPNEIEVIGRCILAFVAVNL